MFFPHSPEYRTLIKKYSAFDKLCVCFVLL